MGLYDKATQIKVSCIGLEQAPSAYLHPFHRVAGGVGLVDELGVLHVFSQPLEETQRLIEDDWHGNL